MKPRKPSHKGKHKSDTDVKKLFGKDENPKKSSKKRSADKKKKYYSKSSRLENEILTENLKNNSPSNRETSIGENSNIHFQPKNGNVDLVPDSADVLFKDKEDSTFVEPTTKEKLRYLRYFRLVTHRKRNGVYKRLNGR